MTLHSVAVVGTLPLLLGVEACRCAPPTIMGKLGNGSTWCGDGQHPYHSSKCGHLLVRASDYRMRVCKRLRTVWRRPAPPNILAWMLADARLPPLWVGQREHHQRF